MTSPPADDNAGLTLDDLERASGIPSRTIRFYRQSGLIAAPRRQGRRAYYDPDQLTRLRMIGDLRDRGLGLEAIAKVIEDPAGEQASLAGLLQIGDELRKPWIDDRAAVLTLLEVQEVVGTTDPGQITILEQFGIIAPTSPNPGSTYNVPSVALLSLAGDINEAGIDPAIAFLAWQTMQGVVGKLARDLVTLFTRLDPDVVERPTLDELMSAFEELRPIALQAVQLAFAHEIQLALDEFVEHGGVFEMKSIDDQR